MATILVAPLMKISKSPVVIGFDKIRFKPYRLGEILYRFRNATRFNITVATIVINYVPGLQPESFMIILYSFLITAKFMIDSSSIIVRIGIIVLESDGIIKILNCLLMLSRISVNIPPSIIRLGIIRIQSNCCVITINGCDTFPIFMKRRGEMDLRQDIKNDR